MSTAASLTPLSICKAHSNRSNDTYTLGIERGVLVPSDVTRPRTRLFFHAGVRRQQGPGPVSEEVVPVVGVVHHQTSLGVFLEVAQRRVFIPANCMTTPSQVFEVGEPVTIWVLARFAEQEGLNP